MKTTRTRRAAAPVLAGFLLLGGAGCAGDEGAGVGDTEEEGVLEEGVTDDEVSE